MDFSSLHKRDCKGVDNPSSEESDFEFWSPSDHISEHKCLMGHTRTYIRRKKES